MGRNHSLRKVYRCVMSLPWESWWSMNAIRFVFLRLNKNRGVDLLLKNECNSGNLGERCDLFKLCCHHHWSQLWSWMWWKYDQSCQHVDPAKSRTGWDWLTLDLVTLFRENGCFQMREDARWLCTRVAICYQLLFCGILHFGSFCSLAVGLADGEHDGKWWKQSNLRNQEIRKMGFLWNHKANLHFIPKCSFPIFFLLHLRCNGYCSNVCDMIHFHTTPRQRSLSTDLVWCEIIGHSLICVLYSWPGWIWWSQLLLQQFLSWENVSNAFKCNTVTSVFLRPLHQNRLNLPRLACRKWLYWGYSALHA